MNGTSQSLTTTQSASTAGQMPFGTSTSGQLYIGDGTPQSFKMHDLCFYNAHLSSSEVSAIYNSDTQPSSLVNRWNPSVSDINNTTRIISPATGSTNLNWNTGMTITFSDVT